MSPSAPKEKSSENSPGCSNAVKGYRLEKKINELISKLNKAQSSDFPDLIEKSSDEPIDNDNDDSYGVIIRGSFIMPEIRTIVFRNPSKRNVLMKIELSVSNRKLLELTPSEGIIENGGQIKIDLTCYPKRRKEDYEVVEYVTAVFTELSTRKDREMDKIYFPVIHITPLPGEE
uniref:Major sperm protein n=1 Tax=Caenorhabditis tropicalis TaxID=1561998 RepID=A0A1I7U0H5_9PELO